MQSVSTISSHDDIAVPAGSSSHLEYLRRASEGQLPAPGKELRSMSLPVRASSSAAEVQEQQAEDNTLDEGYNNNDEDTLTLGAESGSFGLTVSNPPSLTLIPE